MQITGKVKLPKDKKIAVNIGCDFDAFSVWLETFEKTSQAYMSRGEYGAEVGVPRILELFKKYKIKSSFCIPGHTARSYPEVCKEILKQGHEVLHHGDLHEDPTFLNEQKEEEIIIKGLDALNELGIKPIGYRSPGFDMSSNTLKLLEKYDFKYDSSLMGNDYYPYHPRYCEVNTNGNRFGEPCSIIEMPVSWYLDDFPHSAFIGTRTGMRPQSQIFEIWKTYFDYAIKHIEGGMMVIATHPQIIGQPHNITMLEKFINYMKSNDAWITSLKNIYEQIDFK